MNRENCRKFIDRGIFEAYASGKDIMISGQIAPCGNDVRFDANADMYEIRKTARPFTVDELRSIIDKVILRKDKKTAYVIAYVSNYEVHLNNYSKVITNQDLFNNFTFIDGSICGVME